MAPHTRSGSSRAVLNLLVATHEQERAPLFRGGGTLFANILSRPGCHRDNTALGSPPFCKGGQHGLRLSQESKNQPRTASRVLGHNPVAVRESYKTEGKTQRRHIIFLSRHILDRSSVYTLKSHDFREKYHTT